MKYIIEIHAHVAEHDQDILMNVPEAILNRFAGTAIHIDKVTVKKAEE